MTEENLGGEALSKQRLYCVSSLPWQPRESERARAGWERERGGMGWMVEAGVGGGSADVCQGKE